PARLRDGDLGDPGRRARRPAARHPGGGGPGIVRRTAPVAARRVARPCCGCDRHVERLHARGILRGERAAARAGAGRDQDRRALDRDRGGPGLVWRRGVARRRALRPAPPTAGIAMTGVGPGLPPLLRPYWRLLAIAFAAMLVEVVASLLDPWPLKIIF